MVPSYYVDVVNGLDSNPGTFALPFKTTARAGLAMNGSSIKITNIRSGTYNMSTLTVSSNQTWVAYPGDPQWSAILNFSAANSGGNGQSSVTLKNLAFTQSVAGAMFLLVDCPGLKIQGCKATCTGNQNFIQSFRCASGLRIQGNNITADTWNVAGGIFPINLIYNDGANYNDAIVNSNTIVGGTFPIQIQDQGGGIWTNFHCDWNTITGFGSASSTIGNIGISNVGAASASNNNNTCTGNSITSAISGGVGIEAGTAACTNAQNSINTNWGFSISNCPGSLFNGNTLTNITQDAFSADGAYTGTNIEIRTNTVNGSSRSGAGLPTNLVPLPSATGLTTYTPSTPYAG